MVSALTLEGTLKNLKNTFWDYENKKKIKNSTLIVAIILEKTLKLHVSVNTSVLQKFHLPLTTTLYTSLFDFSLKLFAF